MPKRTRGASEVRLDVPQAIKRAFMYRGRVPNNYDRRGQSGAKQDASDDTQTAPTEPATQPEPQEAHEKLIDITIKAQDVLFKADTVFPFTLFPDSITLDREKLTVATRSFFRVAKIVSVPVSSISSAEADVGPFFGALHMASKFFVQNTYTVNFLWRHDAVRIQHLLQGFIIANEKKIDITDIEKEDLLILLNDLGQGVNE
jgi:hypothetical protein